MSDLISYTLNEIAEFSKGISYSSSDYTENGTGITFITIKSILKGGGYDKTGLKTIRNRFTQQDLLSEDDLLIAITDLTRDGDIVGSPIIIPKHLVGSVASMDLVRIILNESITCTRYLYYFLMLPSTRRYFVNHSSGSTVLHLETKSIPKLTIPLLSLDDQKRVVKILSTVDEVIEKTEAAIDKYQAIKAGMMQDLFTRGIDTQTGKLRPTIEEAPELYKESELGWIPKEWDVTDFDDVIKEYFDFRGKTPLKLGMNWGGGSIKAISANNIEPGFINFNKEHYLASEDLYRAWMNHGDCSKGDVVMTSEAPLGVVAQIPDNNKYILSQRVFLFKVKPSSITNDYLYYLMNTDRFQNDLQRQSSGSTVTGIQQARLARIRMQLTRSLEEQLHISKILKSIDLGISDNKEMLSKYKNLKHGLMADLLTGKVRVNLNHDKVENR